MDPISYNALPDTISHSSEANGSSSADITPDASPTENYV